MYKTYLTPFWEAGTFIPGAASSSLLYTCILKQARLHLLKKNKDTYKCDHKCCLKLGITCIPIGISRGLPTYARKDPSSSAYIKLTSHVTSKLKYVSVLFNSSCVALIDSRLLGLGISNVTLLWRIYFCKWLG